MSLPHLLRRIRSTVSGPLHRRALRQRVQLGQAPMMIPFYHRVADIHPNPWTISRQGFLRHVDYCLKHLSPCSMAGVQKAVHDGRCDRPTITFTFDDGYAENMEYALPLLLERQIPCTYFVTVNNVIEQKPFAHDLERKCPLPVNTPSHVRQLADAGIEIGLHSRDHVDFSTITQASDLKHQISDAKDELEQMIGRPVRYFAFPFGMPPQLTPTAIDAIHDAKLEGFCSAFGAYNLPGRDAFHLRRFHGDCDFSRFENWTSFDPRKVREEPSIKYTLPPPKERNEIVEAKSELSDEKTLSTPDVDRTISGLIAPPIGLPLSNHSALP